MALFELVVVLLFGAAVLTTVSQRFGLPFPALLALGGAALALAPSDAVAPRLDPDLALVLFVAPVLLDTAYDTSLRDLKNNWRPISGLVLAAVVVTVIAVAFVARALVPDMPWGAAVALGAVVAPPDAVAASAVLRQLSPPYRILVILEGESLLNDATALLIYRAALYAVAGHFSAWTTVPLFVAGSLGGLVLGFLLARLLPKILARLAEGPVAITMQFVGTFGAWILAEAVGLSPILTVVAFAITLARTASHEGAEARLSAFAVWDTAVFVLNALAFILMGLQLREIGRTAEHETGHLVAFGGAILATVVVVRMGWVLVYALGVRFRSRRDTERAGAAPGYKAALVLGWCGMRGVVTLATALALPYGGAEGSFPHRDMLVTAAFAVVLGTLVLQGATLGPLIRWLRLSDDGMVAREAVHARQEAARAALDSLRRADGPEAVSLRQEYNFRLREDTPRDETLHAHAFGRLRLRAIRAERATLNRLRRSQRIGDTAYQTVQEELDWAEGHAVHRRRGFTAEAPAEPLDEVTG